MIVKCPECGNLVSDKIVKCPKCGASILKQDNSKETLNNSSYKPLGNKKQKTKLSLLILCSTLSLALLGSIGYIVFKNVTDSSHSDKQTFEDSIIASNNNQTDVSVKEADVLEKAEQLFYYIPDHDKVNEKARPFMTVDLYESLSAAWDVPRWPDGEIGNEEFLWYFITGNDPSDTQQVKSAELVSVRDQIYIVNVEYLEFWGNTSADNLTSITLILVMENGEFLLDDFGDGVKSRCKQYVQEEVNNFLSGKTNKYMKDNQSGDWYTEEYISNVNKSFKEYLSNYKEYINHLGGAKP